MLETSSSSPKTLTIADSPPQVDGDAKITDGSFIEAFPSGAQPPSVTG